MALTVVRNAMGGADANGTTHDLAQAATPAAGNLLAVFLRWNSNTVTISSVTETEADPDNTYTDSGNGTVDNGTTLRGQTHYVASIDASSAITTRWTTSGNVVTHRAGVEINGQDTTTQVDAFNEATGTTTGTNETISGGAVTTTVDDCLVLAFFATGGNHVATQAGSWLIIGTPTARLTAVYQVVGAAGSYTPQTTLDASGLMWISQTVAIRPLAAAGGQPTWKRFGGVPFMGGQPRNQSARVW